MQVLTTNIQAEIKKDIKEEIKGIKGEITIDVTNEILKTPRKYENYHNILTM